MLTRISCLFIGNISHFLRNHIRLDGSLIESVLKTVMYLHKKKKVLCLGITFDFQGSLPLYSLV